MSAISVVDNLPKDHVLLSQPAVSGLQHAHSTDSSFVGKRKRENVLAPHCARSSDTCSVTLSDANSLPWKFDHKTKIEEAVILMQCLSIWACITFITFGKETWFSSYAKFV